jgi:hypothetical protein
MVVQVALGKKQDPNSKITRAKRAGAVAREVELLPTNCKVLSSNPSATKKEYIHIRIYTYTNQN